MPEFLMGVLTLVSLFLILVILIQRGRGGGLVGAFSGMGGQSAFGTKAGDVFTKITIILITIWVILAGVTGIVARNASGKRTQKLENNTSEKRGLDDLGGDKNSDDKAAGGEKLMLPDDGADSQKEGASQDEKSANQTEEKASGEGDQKGKKAEAPAVENTQKSDDGAPSESKPKSE